MVVRIEEISGIAASERILCRFYDPRTGLLCLLHYGIYFFPFYYIMPDGEFRCRRRLFRQ